MKSRRKLEKISEQMKEWSSVLGEEVKRWPGITSRNMFGMTVFYSEGVIFAALPRTRSFDTPNSVAFKLHRVSAKTVQRLRADPRIGLHSKGERDWISFEIRNSGELDQALEWFLRAYESCGGNSKRR